MSTAGNLLQCPCCDYFTLTERGSFEACRVCYWEDSGQDLSSLDAIVRPNPISLREARANFLAFGACDQSALSLVLGPNERAGLRREVRSNPT